MVCNKVHLPSMVSSLLTVIQKVIVVTVSPSMFAFFFRVTASWYFASHQSFKTRLILEFLILHIVLLKEVGMARRSSRIVNHSIFVLPCEIVFLVLIYLSLS